MIERLHNFGTLVMRHRDRTVVARSSSGGVFYELACHILSKGGVVYGASFVDDGSVVHARISSKTDLAKLLGSKYVQSKLGGTFKMVQKDLEQKTEVLFVGTPCQCAALETYVSSQQLDQSHLHLVDFVCHGTPASRYWAQFIKEKLGSKPINRLSFRDKTYGWINHCLVLNDDKQPFFNTPYGYFFQHDYILSEPCYSCRHKGRNRVSELTLGDAWHVWDYCPEMHDDMGVSVVTVNRPSSLFEEILPNFVYSAVDDKEAYKYNPSYYFATRKPDDLILVREWIEKRGLTRAFIKKTTPSLMVRIKRLFGRIFRYPLRLFRPVFLWKAKKNRLLIGIFTLFDINQYNFGNRLQNYALTAFLKECGYKVESILLAGFNGPQNLVQRRKVIRKQIMDLDEPRQKIIRDAERASGIRERWIYNDRLGIKSIFRYARIVYGGDQLWNFCWGSIRTRMGQYCIPTHDIPKYSYSVSFCNYYYDKERTDAIKDCLSDFINIGVREKESIGYLNELGIHSVHTLDAVFLLSADEWAEVEQKYKTIDPPKENYLFCYFLSEGEAETYAKKASEFAHVHNLICIDAYRHGSAYANINHFDFSFLIRRAAFVMTDSYHGMLFSALYSKRVLLLDRENVANGPVRFASFLSALDIEYAPSDHIWIDFSDATVQKKLKKLVAQSIEYAKSICK